MQDASTPFVHLLGAAQVSLSGTTYPFTLDKPYLLLAYLAWREDWVWREALAHLFWPEGAPDQARGNLRRLLGRTRDLGCAQELEIERDRVRWPVATDLAAFRRAVDARHWSLAVTLHRGPLLHGLDPTGTGEVAAWLERERGRLHGLWRTALLARAEELGAAGAHLEAAELLEPLLLDDEFDETILHAHVAALLRAGGRARARQVYDTFMARLRDELGLEPTADLEQLGRTLNASAEVPVPKLPPLPADAPAVAPRVSPPRLTTSFLGRDLELTEIKRLLHQPDCRLLTLTGPGGIGKTRLALEASQVLAESFADGVFTVPLETVAESASLPAALASSLGFHLQGHDRPLLEVGRAIGEKKLLLVMDNFEHLLEGAGITQELLDRCPNLRLLVTSRERLGVPAEWLLHVDGLPYPDGEDFSPVLSQQFDAVALFIDRARRVRPEFIPTDEDLPHLLTICRLVEGAPLGLELAAVWVRALSLQEIAREIGGNLDFLGQDGRGRAERHGNLRATFDHSWRLLTPREQSAFRSLAVFRGSFHLEAARRVTGVALPVLAALVDKSLLLLTPGGRYHIHALLQQYAAELLAAHPDEQTGLEEQHGRYYLALVTSLGEAVRSPGGHAALRALDEEFASIRAAWDWAVAASRVEMLRPDAVVWGLSIYLDRRVRYAEGFAIFSETVRRLGGDEPGTARTLVTAGALIRQAWFGMRLGRYAESRALAEHALRLAPTAIPEAVFALNTLGAVAERSGEYESARRHFQEALARLQRLGFEVLQGDVLLNLGMVEAVEGQLDQAQRHVREALALYRRHGHHLGIAAALEIEGSVALEAGRLEEARLMLEQGLVLAHDLGFHQRIPSTLSNLAQVAFEQGDLDEAQRRSQEALAALRTFTNPTLEIAPLNLLGRVCRALGLDEEAQSYLARGLHLAWSIHETPQLLEGLAYLAEGRVLRGWLGEAAPLLELVSHHPAAGQRLQHLAHRLLEGVRPSLSATDLAEAAIKGDPSRLEGLVDEALDDLSPWSAEAASAKTGPIERG